jgi:hypothetical protein
VVFGGAFLAATPCLAASEFVDTAATYLAVFIIVAVPIGGIWLFWLVHILPEKIAEKRHHPQKDAIQVLCLLSLVFGGMLWPFAWLWAYSKPVFYKMAYGRDKHDEYYTEGAEHGERTSEPLPLNEELGRLRHDLEVLGRQGELSGPIQAILERIAKLENRAASGSAAEGVR